MEIALSADRVVVIEGVSLASTRATTFASTKRVDIWKAAQALETIDTGRDGVCACSGGPVIQFFRNEKRILVVEYLDRDNVHFSETDDLSWERALRKPSRLIDWLENHGVPGIRQAERRAKAQAKTQAKRDAARARRWSASMPRALRSLTLSHPVGELGEVDLPVWQAAMGGAFPDRAKRIGALLDWFGSVEGLWSGFPIYEEVAEQLLLQYDTRSILEAIDVPELTAVRLEGAARLLAGWTFGQQRPNDGSLIPIALKRRLLEHSLKSKDDDKRARAISAFGASLRRSRVFPL